MAMRRERSLACWSACLLALVAGLGLATAAQAHNLDTSYARFRILPTAIEARLTYDLYSLVKLVPTLDANQDRQLTNDELQAAVPAIRAYLAKHILFEIDGERTSFGAEQPVAFPPGVGDAIPEQDYHAATSLVNFDFVHLLAHPASDVWVQFELFAELGDRHTVLAKIEHNGQEYEVLFRRWEPDYLYDTGYQPPKLGTAGSDASSTSTEPATSQAPQGHPAVWRQIASFFKLGVEHIFLGYDHILFLLSLLVVSRFRELVKIVTSFTVAHTITLILATLDVIELPSKWVESAIAATIVYVAVENFWVRDTAHRWRLTFAFGLIHGFGFAGVLQELGLPTQGLVRSLIAFNLGVEVGQLVIVSVLFLPMAAMAQWRFGRQAQLVLSALIALCGLGWLIDRVGGFDFMPF